MNQFRSKTLLTGLAIAFACGSGAVAADGGYRGGSKIETVSRMAYDAVTDDLLTAGLGADGLAGAAPAVADPVNPTVAELRRLAIYNNYRALVDVSSGGGYGRLYGPNIAADGTDTGGQGLIPGVEVIGLSKGGRGREDVTYMVQVPSSFDPSEACIVTAPSSGSRGVYGAIGTAGEWGLKNGCAVAYTDKGTGLGVHNLQLDTVNLVTGERAPADDAKDDANFIARVSDKKREAFNAETPDRFAVKHAHSQQNPEADWGNNVLQSIKYAFEVLNDEYPDARIKSSNTIVIASSVSNGGGASVRAAEDDRKGLIDGIAVSEPNVNPRPNDHFAIIQGAGDPYFEHSKSLFDYFTLLNVYQGCAGADPALALAPLNFASSPDRCASLAALGLLSGATLAEQAAEAQEIINGYGFLPEQNILQPSHWFINVPQGIAVTYANSYGRFSVLKNTCGYSFGATNAVTNEPTPIDPAAEAVIFATGNGIPPTGGINLINNDAPGGPLLDRVSTLDQNLDGALCLRALATGQDPVTGKRLRGEARAMYRQIKRGIRQIRANGNLHRKPAIFVTGRDDAILPPNHTSRAYFGLNQKRERGRGNLSYVEVLNAQHLDVLNGLAGFGFAERWIPLHHYFIQALDLMFDHLKNGTPLPPSQVVRTTPRGEGAPDITEEDNLPPIASSPDAGSLIVFDGGAVKIPD